MKRVLLGMLAIMMLVMSGCGDTSVAVVVPIVPVINPPSITAYRFTQDRVREFINGSVDYYAPDSDIDTITVAVFDSSGRYMGTPVPIRLNLPVGIINGTIPFSIDYLSYPNGSYTFSIYLTDFKGNISNQIVDGFLLP